MIVVINACKTLADESSPLKQDVLLNFLVSLGYDPLNLPLADLLRRYHQLSGRWLIVSPIHWQASHNDAQIVAIEEGLQLREDEAKLAYTLFAEHLAQDGMRLHYHSPYLWLLLIDDKPPISAKGLHDLVHKPFMQELALLGKEMYWQKFITQSQMFFATTMSHTLLNGVWLWSTSTLKAKIIQVCADRSFYPFAEVSQVNAKAYSPSVSLRDIDILLLDNLESLSQEHQKELKKMPGTWYWNDFVEVQAHQNILIRLWRKLIHAH